MPHRHLKQQRLKLLEGIGVPGVEPFQADRFQLDAVESLRAGNDTLVIAPTGSGKTYIAIQAMEEVVRSGGRVIYTAPLKALSNAKYAELKKRFEPGYSVGLLTGDRKIAGDSAIVVATTEIYRNDLYSLREHYSLVVLDELHYLADPQRGPVWEESIILSPRNSTLLMLSASISNPEEIADWIGSIRNKPVQVIRKTDRPVPLRFGFIHPEHGLIPLEDNGQVLTEVAQFYSTNSRQNIRHRSGRRGHGRPGRRR